MNRRAAIIGVALLLVLLASALGAAKKDAFWGEGTRVNVLGQVPAVITADQECWVRHGVTGTFYPELQRNAKEAAGLKSAVTAGRVKFELYINGEQIRLRTQRTVFPGDEPGTGNRHWHHYVQFEPYHFEPGVYEFVGVWIAMNPNTGLAAVSPFIRVTTLTVLEP